MLTVNGRLIVLVTFCIENAFYYCIIVWKIKGAIDVTGRWGRRRKKLLDNLKERTGYLHLKKEALDRTMWRAGFGRVFEPVVRQTTKWMSEYLQCLNYYCAYHSIHSFISIHPWRAGLAGNRAQSCDGYGSGTLHPGQVLGVSLPLFSPASVPNDGRDPSSESGTVGEKDVR